MTSLPTLDRTLGSLDHRVRSAAAGHDSHTVPGRRAAAVPAAGGRAPNDRGPHGGAPEGQGFGGQDLWIHPAWVGRGVRVTDATLKEAVETPLGVERRLEVAGVEVIERTVVSRDAPVIWVEWVAPGGSVPRLELAWRAGLEVPGAESPGPRGLTWEALEGRGLQVRRQEPDLEALFVMSVAPVGWTVNDAPDGLHVAARATVPADGLRLAVVGIGADSDRDRLLRIAGRTRVAVRAREGAANRVLEEGFGLSAPDAGLVRKVDRARVWLAATGPESVPQWRVDRLVATNLARLAVGDFDTVGDRLRWLAGLVEEGRVPAEGAGTRVLRRDGTGGPLFLRLVTRYLAWSGDRTGVARLWPVVEAVWEAAGQGADDAARSAGQTGVSPGLAAELAITAEELGRDAMAGRIREHAGVGAESSPLAEGPAGVLEGFRHGRDGAGRAGVSAVQGDAIRWVVEDLLGARPDAARGRLVLRPRAPEGWDRYAVRGLPVGPATVTVTYGSDGPLHRLTVAQDRGAAPLQVVLEPELPGQKIVASRVDGEAAELDAVAAAGRWRVSVQLVLDHVRTLEVEIALPAR